MFNTTTNLTISALYAILSCIMFVIVFSPKVNRYIALTTSFLMQIVSMTAFYKNGDSFFVAPGVFALFTLLCIIVTLIVNKRIIINAPYNIIRLSKSHRSHLFTLYDMTGRPKDKLIAALENNTAPHLIDNLINPDGDTLLTNAQLRIILLCLRQIFTEKYETEDIAELDAKIFNNAFDIIWDENGLGCKPKK